MQGRPIRRPSGRIAVGVIFTTMFLDFMGFSILIPVLPLHLKGMGADSVDVGLILALYVIAMVLFLPLWGWISDRVGRRPVLLICLIGTAGSFAVMATATSLGVFYAARILQGFFGASVGTAQAYIIDITSDEDRVSGIGLIGAAGGAGMVFGPGLGGLLYVADPALPFYAPALVALVAGLGAALFLPESKASTPSDLGWGSLARTLIPTPLLVFFKVHDNRTRVYLYLFFHVFAGFAALEAMFPFYASERFSWGVQEVGFFLSYIGIVMALTQGILVGFLTRLTGEAPLVIGGLALTGLCMVALAQTHSIVPLAVLGTAVALGFGLALPAFTSLFSKACGNPDETGAYLAHSQAMAQTGRGIGVIWGGLAVSTLGTGAPFLLGGIGLLAGLGLFVIGLRFLLPDR